MFGKIMSSLKDFLQKMSISDNVMDYICGSEALPLPFSPEEESDMLGKLSLGDEEVKSKLVEHNLRLVVYIARKFDNTGVDADDLISVGTIGLIKAINSFKTDKNIKLATYASRCIENEILMYLRRMVRLKSEVSFDEPLNTDWEGNELLLSDILGTDSDTVYKDIETSVEKQLLRDALKKLPRARTKDHVHAFRAGGPRGNDAKRRSRSSRDLAKLHIPSGKKDHIPSEKRNEQTRLRS